MMRYKSTFVLAVLVMCASFAVAHADIKYTVVNKYTSAKSQSQPSNPDEETETIFVTPEKTRREVVESDDSAPDKEIYITRCDLHQTFTIDESLKIYTVFSMTKEGTPKSLASDDPVPKDIPEEKFITHFSVKKLGSKKINGFDTQGYLIVTSIHGSGYEGNVKASGKIKKWVADVPGAQACDSSTYKSSTDVIKTRKGYRKIISEFTGDVIEMSKISAQFTVRSKGTEMAIDEFGALKLSQNVISFERIKKLDDNLFEVPSGYRKVSFGEYYKLQSQAKKKAIAKNKKSKTHP